MDTNMIVVAVLLLAVGGWAWWRQRGHGSLHDREEDDESSPRFRARRREDGEPGRAAIDAALARVHHDTRTRRWELDAEGDPTLVEVLAFLVLIPAPHWHYVALGLGELGDKVTDDPEHSGLGIELTARVALGDDDEPPRWPVDLLCALAARAKASGAFAAGATLTSTSGDLDLPAGVDTLLFTRDRTLGTVFTSNGQAAFLQVLPVAADERELLARGGTDELLAEMRKRDPALIWR